MVVCNRTPFIHSLKEVAMAIQAVVMADQMASQTFKLVRREEVAEGTMAFHFEKPSGFKSEQVSSPMSHSSTRRKLMPRETHALFPSRVLPSKTN